MFRVVPPGDHEKLATAWTEILAMPSAARIELGERRRLRASQEFELGAAASRYESVFREMIHGPQPGRMRHGGSVPG